jgi:hypothetical protein
MEEKKAQESKQSARMGGYATYCIEYWAWPDGARIKTEGRFEMAGKSRDEVMLAALRRWPEMHITRCEVA